MTAIDLCRKLAMVRLSGCQTVRNLANRPMDTQQRDLISKHINGAHDDVERLLKPVPKSHPDVRD